MKEVRLLRELLDPPSTAVAEKVETVTTPVSHPGHPGHPEQNAPARKETTAVKKEVTRTRLGLDSDSLRLVTCLQDFTATLQTESRSNAHVLYILGIIY